MTVPETETAAPSKPRLKRYKVVLTITRNRVVKQLKHGREVIAEQVMVRTSPRSFRSTEKHAVLEAAFDALKERTFLDGADNLVEEFDSLSDGNIADALQELYEAEKEDLA